MARKVFFSFHYGRDVWRVSQVRNSNLVGWDKTPFHDKADWEELKRQGNQEIKRWIDSQLKGCSVTVVLIGKDTHTREWVKYEIEQSIKMGKGLIGVHVAGMKNSKGEVEKYYGTNPLPSGYKTYKWEKENGRENLSNWIEKAAKEAGR